MTWPVLIIIFMNCDISTITLFTYTQVISGDQVCLKITKIVIITSFVAHKNQMENRYCEQLPSILEKSMFTQ